VDADTPRGSGCRFLWALLGRAPRFLLWEGTFDRVPAVARRVSPWAARFSAALSCVRGAYYGSAARFSWVVAGLVDLAPMQLGLWGDLWRIRVGFLRFALIFAPDRPLFRFLAEFPVVRGC